MTAKESLESAMSRFRTMAADLASFMADSERVFLATGTALQSVEDQAQRVLGESSSDARTQGGADSAQNLRDGLGELDQHLARGKDGTDKGVNALVAVLGGIEKLSGLDRDFQAIVATLHALASTTHLENSRRDGARGGFDSVVTDLRTMALRIKPKFGEVLNQGLAVRSTAESALTQARAFLDRHQRDLATLRRETQKHLSSMAEACRFSEALASKSSGGMESVRSHVAQVLQSLQVQDIARQMLEHVVQDMNEFVESARAATVPEAATADVQSWLAELALVSRVEAAQLANACDRVVNGLSQIDHGLEAIVANLTMLARESSNLGGRSNSSAIVTSLEHGVRATAETARAYDAHQEAMLKALANVCATAAGVDRLVDEMAALGKDARFIGLNAMVKAVRVGNGGATLAVLAREIQNMSDEIQTFTTSAAAIMQSVGKEARLLVNGGAEQERDSATSGAAIAGKLEALVQALGAYQASLDRAVASLLSGSGDLRLKIAPTCDALHALVERARSLRKIACELDQVHRMALLDARGAKPPAGRSHGENGRHTMEEERVVQRAALGGVSASAEKAEKPADSHSAEGSIEFF